jgi:hypothetical protein
MNEARSDFGIAPAGDGFFHVFGGRSSKGDLSSTEGYSFTAARWTVEPETLPSRVRVPFKVFARRLPCVFLNSPEFSAPIGLVYCPVDRQVGFPQW